MTTDRVLMIRPRWFSYDQETAATNAFQQRPVAPPGVVAESARAEFDRFAEALSAAGVRIVVVEDRPDVITPDSVFPNNWLSFHRDGRAVLYPMATPSRQREVRPDVIDEVEAFTGARWRRINLTALADRGAIIEGTGSLVFDPLAPLAFACRSARTTDAGLDAVEEAIGIETVRFNARDAGGVAYYHTNVMMAVADSFAIVCDEAIDEPQRSRVLELLGAQGRRVVSITRAQTARFAGNALALRSTHGDAILAMSSCAHSAFDASQRQELERHARIITSELNTIERVGGGSARCMLAEINLPA